MASEVDSSQLSHKGRAIALAIGGVAVGVGVAMWSFQLRELVTGVTHAPGRYYGVGSVFAAVEVLLGASALMWPSGRVGWLLGARQAPGRWDALWLVPVIVWFIIFLRLNFL